MEAMNDSQRLDYRLKQIVSVQTQMQAQLNRIEELLLDGAPDLTNQVNQINQVIANDQVTTDRLKQALKDHEFVNGLTSHEQ